MHLVVSMLTGEHLHRTYISGIERGARNPTILVIDQLASALDVSPARLLERASKLGFALKPLLGSHAPRRSRLARPALRQETSSVRASE